MQGNKHNNTKLQNRKLTTTTIIMAVQVLTIRNNNNTKHNKLRLDPPVKTSPM